MTKLDAVGQGLNLTLAWNTKKVELVTDSSAVHRWISDWAVGEK